MLEQWQADGGVGFGPNPFEHPRMATVCEEVCGETPDELRAQVLDRAADVPGIYGMFDECQRLIYVGKSKKLRSRLRSYFVPGARQEKPGRIVQFTKTIAFEPAVSEFAALLRELQLIRDYRPRFNVAGQPGRWRPCYICIGRPPAERVFLAQKPSSTSGRAYGPVMGSRLAVAAVEALNKLFGLRDCRQTLPMVFKDDLSLFPQNPEPGCLRFEMQSCLGPCAAGCSRQQYQRRVRSARKFLEGESAPLLERLRGEMQSAAANHRFEQAALLRDRLAALEWLDLRLKQLGEARKDFRFVYPVQQQANRAVWYLIERGQVMAALEPPRTQAAARRTAHQLEQWQRRGLLDDPHGLLYRSESVLIVAPWFHRNPAEMQRVLPIDQALAQCQQKGNLSSKARQQPVSAR